MSSQKQIEANRRNALKSTGPKSDDGKARSRLNALRHGLTAEQAVLPHEDENDYEKLREGMLESYAPENSAEQAIVEELANAYWRLLRMHRVLGSPGWMLQPRRCRDSRSPAPSAR